ncbi:ethanolamine ammonia-lyase reactivating factor EutA [Brevibacillus sp. B_LB10_24]|uniref:ethanolamine ammonia-lyase reactivating factor EutA n=1 Tax=Brevibacillus sp. B_LB10_24 TaxID=3380645 RepID=UPI0038BDD2DB
MEEQWITSVGIDLGTSTTKFIVSRLRLARMSSHFSLPRYQIVERELIYAGAIYSTPLKTSDEIDVDRVSRILQEEYKRAGLTLSEVKSGAVIITGETATKQNAQEIVHFLAERSGDFVVATAGADLEGVLAGMGSGAQARSRNIHGVIANIDVGGGTANTALFQRGKAIGTVTFHIGGRLVRLDQAGVIHYIAPALQPWLRERGFRIVPGQQVSYALLQEIARQLSRCLLSYLAGKERGAAAGLLLGQPLAEVPEIDEVMISGGIGQLIGEPAPTNLEETAKYGDFGPLLAHALAEESRHCPFRVLPAEQTVRATVIGAGMQSTEISGSTVHIDASLLPLRNVPVLKLETGGRQLTAAAVKAEIGQVMELGRRLFDPTVSPPFALAITGMGYCSYAELQLLADELSAQFSSAFPQSGIMAVICENDMAKALGQSLTIRCKNRPRVICIDQVRVEYGDYIDLGEPIAGTMIPVVIKTLAFHEAAKEGSQ